MRILMLSQFYPPIIGGVEQHVRNLSAELVARGHEVAVATSWHDGLPAFELDGGIRVHRIRATLQRARWLYSDSRRRHVPPLPDPELVLALRRIVARERPEIVHAHNWLVHSFLPLKPWSGAKLVVTLHDYSLVCAQQRLMERDTVVCAGPAPRKCLGCGAAHYGVVKGAATVLANWAMGSIERRAVDRFLAVSQAVAKGNHLLDGRAPFQVVPNFVPDDVGEPYAGDEARAAALPCGDYLLFVGDLVHDKGISVLLDAYAHLVGAPPLVLIGRPSADLPADLPDNVLVLNDWPHAAVMLAWHRSAIGLVPSLCPDSCPTVALEAMATGTPIIGSRIGGLIDLVADGETGLLVTPGDPTALRQALERLLSDTALRERMSHAARRRAREFQAAKIVPRIERVYQQVLAEDHSLGWRPLPSRRRDSRVERPTLVERRDYSS